MKAQLVFLVFVACLLAYFLAEIIEPCGFHDGGW